MNWCSIIMGFARRDMPKILNSKREVDFNIIAPMPRTLASPVLFSDYNSFDREEQVLCFLTEKLTKPITIDILRDVDGLHDVFRSRTENEIITICDRLSRYEEETIDRLYDAGKILIKNKRAYGYTSWYDFRMGEWGTNQNALSTVVKETTGFEPDDIVTVKFNTIWNYPEGWLRKLSEIGVVFYLGYAIYKISYPIQDKGDCHGEIYYDGNLFTTRELNGTIVYNNEAAGDRIIVDERKYQYDRMMPYLKDWINKTSPEIKVLTTNGSIEELIES